MKQKSNKVFLTVGKTDKTSQDLLAVKRNSIARQGSQLPNRNKQMFDYSRMETKNVSFHESVKRDRDVVHMSSLAKSGENDNDEEIKIQVNTVFDAVQSPLCLVPCEIGRILVFEKIFNNFFF